MGYIILGMGVAFYLGSKGGLGLSGSIYHIINHALFKVTLFLGVGVIYMHTGETDLYKLGGLWRRFPLTAILMLVAVLGITGAPGLNGYASKSLLHHGISEAAASGAWWLIWIERLFLVVGVGTAASFAKLYYLIFLGKPTELEVRDGKSPAMQISMALIAVVMLVIGIRPHLLLDTAIIPAVKGLGMIGISETLKEISFWNFKDIFDMIITLGLGVVVCWAGLKSGVFHWHPPTWLTIEGMAKLILSKALLAWKMILGLYESAGRSIKNAIKSISSRLNLGLNKFDQSKSSNILGVNFIGISADIAILILTLGILIIWYTLKNLSLY